MFVSFGRPQIVCSPRTSLTGLMFSNNEAMLAMAPITLDIVLTTFRGQRRSLLCLLGRHKRKRACCLLGGLKVCFFLSPPSKLIEHLFYVGRDKGTSCQLVCCTAVLCMLCATCSTTCFCCCVRVFPSHEWCVPLCCAVAANRRSDSSGKRTFRSTRNRNRK